MSAVPRSTLRRGVSVVARGAREQPRWFSVAVLGSALYGVMTGAMAWVIGRLTEGVIAPAVAARSVTPAWREYSRYPIKAILTTSVLTT